MDIGFLEEFKQLRDLLASMKELFMRFERLGGNNIGALERRIEATNQKIAQLQSRGDARDSDINRLQNAIVKDQQAIERQRNRDWLIKECMTEEILLAQNTQYQISKYDAIFFLVSLLLLFTC